MYRWSDGQSTRPDDPNTLTANPPVGTTPPGTRFTTHFIESCPTRTNLRLFLWLHLQYRASPRYLWTANALPLLQYPSHCHILLAAAIPIAGIISFNFRIDSNQGFWWDLTQVFTTLFDSRFLTGFDSGFTKLIRFKSFDGIRIRFSWLNLTQGFRLDSTQFSRPDLTHNVDRIRLTFCLIRFESHLKQLLSIWVTSFKSHSLQASGSPTLARVSLK